MLKQMLVLELKFTGNINREYIVLWYLVIL